jgi:hypothetical protein
MVTIGMGKQVQSMGYDNSNHTLTIALVRSTLIEHHGIMCHDILIPNICTAHVKLTGQILTLLPTRQPAEQHSWLWIGDYIKTSSNIQGISYLTEKVVGILVSGLLVELINLETMCVRLRNDINSNHFHALNNIKNTWVVEESALSFACDALWSKAHKNLILLKTIIQVLSPADPSTFPYALPDGKYQIFLYLMCY